MSASEAEAYEAGMALPSDARMRLAIRLLESVEVVDAYDATSEAWLGTEAAAAYDALKGDPSRAVPIENVRDRFETKWAARS